MKFSIDVIYTFDHIEAENEEEAFKIVDAALKEYFYNPTTGEVVMPFIEEPEEEDE